ncbi:MAG: molybdopterin-dependent oxidoreductase [Pseudomonadota bacterium]
MNYWVKDAAGMVIRDRSLEPAFHRQRDYFTPVDQFFVCNSGSTPDLRGADFSLQIRGDSVAKPLTLSLDELRAMPQRTVPAVIECAGNHRDLFQSVMGEKLNKRPHMTEVIWTTGAIGMAEWRGVPLRHVLELAGVDESAYHVCPAGADLDSPEGSVVVPIPVEKAMHEDTLLALEMNGAPLPPDHGFPLRVIVPGWVGTYSVKWVGSIDVCSEHQWVYRNTELYVLMGEHWPEDEYRPARGALVTEQNIKSALALEWNAKLSSGSHSIHGFARSPGSPIARVEWSDDRGVSWQNAALSGPNEKWGWVKFSFEWLVEPGEHALITRAVDKEGRVQTDAVEFNTAGYLFNAVYPHPVTVV